MKTKTKEYKKISKGVYSKSTGKYWVTKMTNGVKTTRRFTNKKEAVKFYNSL